VQSLRLRVIHGGARVEAAGRRQLVVRLSRLSFTPMLDGEVRDADVGLLFDPRHEAEARLCAAWQSALLARDLRVRRNYPGPAPC
jgi:predicted N-formylglutamate amidohydrolase